MPDDGRSHAEPAVEDAPDAVLERKLGRLFPDPEERASARELLLAYGAEPLHREPQRVRLAVLKLSAGDLDKVLHYVDAALGDHRDVLAWAEYPAQMKGNSYRLPPAERARLAAEDRRQYAAWLDE